MTAIDKSVPFFSHPVDYRNESSNRSGVQKWASYAEEYLSYGKHVVTRCKFDLASGTYVHDETGYRETHWAMTVFKIVSYLTIVLPFLAACTKAIYRYACFDSFTAKIKEKSGEGAKESEKLGESGSKSEILIESASSTTSSSEKGELPDGAVFQNVGNAQMERYFEKLLEKFVDKYDQIETRTYGFILFTVTTTRKFVPAVQQMAFLKEIKD